MGRLGLFAGVVGTLLAAGPAAGGTVYGFLAVPDGGGLNADERAGQAQLFVDVSDGGSRVVAFRFFNAGPAASSICDIYFDEQSYFESLVQSDVVNSVGVDFSPGASPKDLPGRINLEVPFQATAGATLDSNPAVQPNGVNPGETLTVKFRLQAGVDFQDILVGLDRGATLSRGTDSYGAIRIGLHVQGFGGGGSESFVSGMHLPPDPGPAAGAAPLPAAAWGGAALLGMIGGMRAIRSRA